MSFDAQAATAAYIDALGTAALTQAQAYTQGNHWLILWGLVVSVLASIVIVRGNLLARLDAWMQGKGPKRRAFVLSAGTFVLMSLLTLPWDLYAGWWRERSYGRSSQPIGDFLGQGTLSMLISSLIAALFFMGVYALMRRAGRLWWAWSAALAAVSVAFLLLVSPVVIEPLFNDYKPVPQGEVRDALLVMAERAGVPADRIFVFDGSRQSNNFTANVSGVGGSARIAISDVAFKGASLDEVKAVTGHEIGHYVWGHVWRSVGILSLVAAVMFFLTDRLFPIAARTIGSSADIADPLGLPVLLMLVSMLGVFAQPVLNALSRSSEADADRYSLQTVNLPDALATALVKTAEYRYPRPGVVEEVLFYSHPSVEKRVRTAMEWKAANPAAIPAR
jgi:STE24 endopeptidase